MKNIESDLKIIPISVKAKIIDNVKNSAARKSAYKILVLLMKKSKEQEIKEIEVSQKEFEVLNTNYKKAIDNLIVLGLIIRNDSYDPHINKPKSYILNFVF